MISLPTNNRHLEYAARAQVAAERSVLSAVTNDLSLADSLSPAWITDPGLRLLLIGLLDFRRKHPGETRVSAARLVKFVTSIGELSRLRELLTIEELTSLIADGHYHGGLFHSNLETLRDAAFQIDRRHRLAELERLPRDQFAAELRALLRELDESDCKLRSEIRSIGSMAKEYPSLREPLIDGICRLGEIVNIISKSKVGKSWMAYILALCIGTGRPWLGKFPCRRGRVLIIDNELHREVIAYRIPEVAQAMEIRKPDYDDALDVLSLRGRLRDINQIGELLCDSLHGVYGAIIIDAAYRMWPAGMSENDNAGMAGFYNTVDRYAQATGATIFLIHHATKGDQGGKDISDVGAGAGSQSRAADTHLVLRPHEAENAVVLDHELC